MASAIALARRLKIATRSYLVVWEEGLAWASSVAEAITIARSRRVTEVLARRLNEKSLKVMRVSGRRLVDTGKRKRRAW